MIFSFASWALLSLTGGFLALWAVWARNISRWRLVSLLGFLMSILISGGAILLSQGWAHNCKLLLPGRYDLIGYTFNTEKITLFLNTDFGPKLCYIPYSDDAAEELQKNGEEAGSEFVINWGSDGEGNGNSNFGEELGEENIEPRPPVVHAPKPEEQPPVFGE